MHVYILDVAGQLAGSMGTMCTVYYRIAYTNNFIYISILEITK